MSSKYSYSACENAGYDVRRMVVADCVSGDIHLSNIDGSTQKLEVSSASRKIAANGFTGQQVVMYDVAVQAVDVEKLVVVNQWQPSALIHKAYCDGDSIVNTLSSNTVTSHDLRCERGDVATLYSTKHRIIGSATIADGGCVFFALQKACGGCCIAMLERLSLRLVETLCFDVDVTVRDSGAAGVQAGAMRMRGVDDPTILMDAIDLGQGRYWVALVVNRQAVAAHIRWADGAMVADTVRCEVLHPMRTPQHISLVMHEEQAVLAMTCDNCSTLFSYDLPPETDLASTSVLFPSTLTNPSGFVMGMLAHKKKDQVMAMGREARGEAPKVSHFHVTAADDADSTE